ncbi:hypothetical protein [Salinicola aestuarinus]|uniref:hypothetical protein n=1 Tax=Salinicola aestuarinus TaxID=1949082 RepID=UPI001300A373|nr:hypothetical protein [Salinicola aestuarinus]
METTKKITDRFATYFILLTTFLISNGVTYLLSERMFVNHLQELSINVEQQNGIEVEANAVIDQCVHESPKGFKPALCEPAIQGLISEVELKSHGAFTLTGDYVESLKSKAQRKHFFENTLTRDYVTE